MKTFIALLAFATIVIACTSNTSGITDTTQKADTILGIVTYGAGYTDNDSIKIYNEDGSIWHLVTYSYVTQEPGAMEFRPFAFYPDYDILAMRAVSKNNNRYEVIV